MYSPSFPTPLNGGIRLPPSLWRNMWREFLPKPRWTISAYPLACSALTHTCKWEKKICPPTNYIRTGLGATSWKQTNKQTTNLFVLSHRCNIFHLQVLLYFGVVYKHQQRFANKLHSHTICVHVMRPEVKRATYIVFLCFLSFNQYLTKVQMQKSHCRLT